MDPCYAGVFYAEAPDAVSGWAPVSVPQRKGTDHVQGIREAHQDIWEVQEALQEQLGQLLREQRALVNVLRTAFWRRGRDRQERRGAGTRRPAAERRTCYACGRRGHLKRDCSYWGGSRMPHPEKGQWQVPRAACRVMEPRQLPACWTCGRTGHFWRDCPGPEKPAQGSLGEARPVKGQRRPKAVKRQGACWGCQKLGHIRRHCPLKKAEGRPREVPGGPEGAKLDPGEVTLAEMAIGGTPQEAGTQTITPPGTERGTQTEWAPQEAGAQKKRVLETRWTQVIMGQATKGTQTLREEGLGDSVMEQAWKTAVAELRKVRQEKETLADKLQDSEKKRVALEAHGRRSQAKKPPYPQGWGF